LALGNNSPQILVNLKDCVLEAVLDILEGKLTKSVIDALYLQIESLQKDLGNDNEALDWFHLSSRTIVAPLTPEAHPNPLAGQLIHFNFICSSI
jgi:hypothetical protein